MGGEHLETAAKLLEGVAAAAIAEACDLSNKVAIAAHWLRISDTCGVRA